MLQTDIAKYVLIIKNVAANIYPETKNTVAGNLVVKLYYSHNKLTKDQI